jgi:hypothetical protein
MNMRQRHPAAMRATQGNRGANALLDQSRPGTIGAFAGPSNHDIESSFPPLNRVFIGQLVPPFHRPIDPRIAFGGMDRRLRSGRDWFGVWRHRTTHSVAASQGPQTRKYLPPPSEAIEKSNREAQRIDGQVGLRRPEGL